MNDVSIGALDGLLLTAYSAANYPPRRQVIPILGDGTMPDTNEVIQESAFGYRRVGLTLTPLTADERDTLRGYYEGASEVSFVDPDDAISTVVLLEYSAQLVGAGPIWSATLVLLALTDPISGS